MFWYSSIQNDHCVFSSTNFSDSFPRMLADLNFFSDSYSISITLILLQFSAVLSSFKCLSIFLPFFFYQYMCLRLSLLLFKSVLSLPILFSQNLIFSIFCWHSALAAGFSPISEDNRGRNSIFAFAECLARIPSSTYFISYSKFTKLNFFLYNRIYYPFLSLLLIWRKS